MKIKEIKPKILQGYFIKQENTYSVYEKRHVDHFQKTKDMLFRWFEIKCNTADK